MAGGPGRVHWRRHRGRRRLRVQLSGLRGFMLVCLGLIMGGTQTPALAAEVDEFREGSDPQYIRLTVYVERDSQKGMVVGKGGRTIKTIGTRARTRIETFLGSPVFLDIWVKTLPKWRSDPSALRRFGFSTATRSP